MNFMERIQKAILLAKQKKGVTAEQIAFDLKIPLTHLKEYEKENESLFSKDIQKLMDYFEIEMTLRFPKEKVEVKEWVWCE